MTEPGSDQSHGGYRPDIDGLRAIAVLVVVVFHAFPTALHGGFVGVDIFFVISGYLISGIIFRQLRAGLFSMASFYANRVRRIFPALLAVLTACGIAGWYLLLPQEYKLLGKHIATSAGFVQNIALQRESGYFDIASDLKPLLHLWSLAIEEQYYLVYPLVVLLAWRASRQVSAVLLVLGLLSFALNMFGVRKDLVATFFWPQTRVWELLAGALLAHAQIARDIRIPATRLQRLATGFVWWYEAPTPPRQQALLFNALSVVGLTLIAVSAVGLSKKLYFPGAWALVPVLGAVALIAAGPGAWINARLLASRPLVAIGLVSYPLYLWHWPLLSFAAIVENGTPSPGLRTLAVLIAGGLAWLTWRYLERPLRFGPFKSVAVWGLVPAMVVVGVSGYVIQDSQGVEQRFPLLADQAVFDKWTWGNNPACTARYPELKGIPYCLLEPDEPPQVAIIGDSHANQYFPGLVEMGLKVINLGKGSCLTFLDVTTHIPLPRPQGEICPPDHLNRAIEFALAQPTVKHIALSARFQQYHDDASEAKIFTGPPGQQFGGNPQVFRATLDKTLARLAASGKNIVFILDNPDPLFDPKECIELPILRRRSEPRSPCATERSSIELRHAGYRAVALELLRKYPSIRVFDPFDALCDDKYCWAARETSLLYRDTDHLSLQGSREVAKTLAPLFQEKPPVRP